MKDHYKLKKGEKKVAFQLLLLSITFQKELKAIKGTWKEDVAGFSIAFYSFQKLKKEKKRTKRNKRASQGESLFPDASASENALGIHILLFRNMSPTKNKLKIFGYRNKRNKQNILKIPRFEKTRGELIPVVGSVKLVQFSPILW